MRCLFLLLPYVCILNRCIPLFLNLNEKLGWFSFEASLKLPLVAQLLSVLWVVLVEINLFNCYARICLEGDEEMPYRDNLYDRIKAYLDSKKPKKK